MKRLTRSPLVPLAILAIAAHAPGRAGEPLPDKAKITREARQILEAYIKESKETLATLVAFAREPRDKSKLDACAEKARDMPPAIASAWKSAIDKMGTLSQGPDPLLVKWRRDEESAWTKLNEAGIGMLTLAHDIDAATRKINDTLKEHRARYEYTRDGAEDVGKLADGLESGKSTLEKLQQTREILDQLPPEVQRVLAVPRMVEAFGHSLRVWAALQLRLSKDVTSTIQYVDGSLPGFEKLLNQLRDAKIDPDQTGNFANAEKQMRERLVPLLASYKAATETYRREVRQLWDATIRALNAASGGVLGLSIDIDQMQNIVKLRWDVEIEKRATSIQTLSILVRKLLGNKILARVEQIELKERQLREACERAQAEHLRAWEKDCQRVLKERDAKLVPLEAQLRRPSTGGNFDIDTGSLKDHIRQIERAAETELATIKGKCDRAIDDLEKETAQKIKDLQELQKKLDAEIDKIER